MDQISLTLCLTKKPLLSQRLFPLCPGADSNCHAHSGATPSRWCVYQFRHLGLLTQKYTFFGNLQLFFCYLLLFLSINVWIIPSANPTRGATMFLRCPTFIIVKKISEAGIITSARSDFKPNS